MKRALAERAKQQHHGDVQHRKVPRTASPSAAQAPHVPRRRATSPASSASSAPPSTTATATASPPPPTPTPAAPGPASNSARSVSAPPAPAPASAPQSQSSSPPPPAPSGRSASQPPPQQQQQQQQQRRQGLPPPPPPKASTKRRRSSNSRPETASAPTSARERQQQQQREQQQQQQQQHQQRRARPKPAHASVMPSSEDESDDDDEKEKKAMDVFYLRHQNRALASELRQYKRRIDLLQRERDRRREKCRLARERVDSVGEAWREMEAGLAAAAMQWKRPDSRKRPKTEDGAYVKDEEGYRNLPPDDAPGSTGAGEDVESVSALLSSLTRLTRAPPLYESGASRSQEPPGESVKEEEGGDEEEEEEKEKEEEEDKAATVAAAQELDSVEKAAELLSRRADALKASMLEVLRCVLDRSEAPPSAKAKSSRRGASKDNGPLGSANLQRRVTGLENRCGELRTRVAELAKSRDDAAASEKRVRRGLYRLASGRMKIADVLEVIDKEDSGMSLFEEFGGEDGHLGALAPSGEAPPAVVSSDTGAGSCPSCAEGDKADSKDVLQLKKKLQDLEEVSTSREMRIAELVSERDGHLKRINDLALANVEENHSESTLASDDVKKSALYAEVASKLATAERRLADLKSELEATKRQWGVTKGDLELARKTAEETEKKNERRLKELAATGKLTPGAGGGREGTTADSSVGAAGDSDRNGEKNRSDPSKSKKPDETAEKTYLSDAVRIIELEHKLKQALENVRQAETVRESLKEATAMTECLQSKLEELKAKNAALVADKAAARQSLEPSTPSASSHASPHKYKDDRSASSSSSSSDRLHREYRKMRKELAAAVASKDSARAKQERAEKERDSLMKTNVRLLKQSTEKDDMNAKSLSTILHLKQLTEQLNQEKDILEKRVKGAEQVALAARLAANAKERVHEEAIREKERTEEQLKKTEEKIEALLTEKEEVESRLSQSKAQMVSVVKDLSTVRQRCDELTTESTAAAQEKSGIMEMAAIAKKEAAEAAKKASAAVSANTASGLGRSRVGGKVKSEFTMEQMETQVKVLKGRLACNVCNERDKQVILTRCRHMFCRQCVDKNIKNRSRKCPGCGQRFDMKDVGDVWL